MTHRLHPARIAKRVRVSLEHGENCCTTAPCTCRLDPPCSSGGQDRALGRVAGRWEEGMGTLLLFKTRAEIAAPAGNCCRPCIRLDVDTAPSAGCSVAHSCAKACPKAPPGPLGLQQQLLPHSCAGRALSGACSLCQQEGLNFSWHLPKWSKPNSQQHPGQPSCVCARDALPVATSAEEERGSVCSK